MLRLLAVFVLVCGFMTPALAQQAVDNPRAETGGAQTLDDIMRRQAEQKVDDTFRRSVTGDPAAAAAPTEQLGTLVDNRTRICGARCAMTWRMRRPNRAGRRQRCLFSRVACGG